MISGLVLTIGGIAIVAGLALDVLVTVFHPHGHGGPFTRVLNRLLWSLVKRAMVRAGETHRSRALALCGPALAPLTIAIWGIWLVVGFAVIYSVPGSLIQVGTPVSGSGSFLESLYYSGYVATTLGIGDVTAATPLVRLITVAEAMLGFALTAIVVTYVLSIYRELLAAHTLALEISNLSQLESGPAQLDRWDRDMCRGLIRAVEAHGQYPVLHYFRPSDPDRSLVLQVARLVQDAPDLSGAESENAHLARAAIRRFFLDLNGCIPDAFRPTDFRGEGMVMPAADRLLDYLGYRRLSSNSWA